ncbi:MAG: hypothetical protein GXP26_13230 [Planctomycetes bacterium]|nr:hypothetical protein [Planctomycetota bacterium]
MRTLISVNIQVDGNWPTDKELENRNAVIAELSDHNLGTFKGAGTGMGSMDFAYEVHDVGAAKVEIAKTVFKHLPGYASAVQSTEAKASKNIKVANDTAKQQAQSRSAPKLDFGMGM